MVQPPGSPDLTPMDFFLWGHIKALIYISTVDSEEDLIACIIEAAVTIRPQPCNFEHTRQSLLRHCWLCIKVSGQMLNICFKLVCKTTFFQKTSVVLLD